MQIFMPSRGRAGKIDTLGNLPDKIRLQTIIAVPEAEYFDYVNTYPQNIVVTVPDGIGNTREWLVQQSPDKIVMLDDDLKFATRRDDDPSRFENASEQDINWMFSLIMNLLKDFPHVGVATREGGNRNTEDTIYNTRILRVLAYDARVLRKEGIHFNRLEVMEDFDVALQLLEKGYDNLCINWIVHDQRRSNAPGGCSTYRTMEKQAEAAHALQALHPDFVRVVTKKTKTAWGGQERTDVVISWKKAIEYGRTRDFGLLDEGTGECQAEEGSFSP